MRSFQRLLWKSTFPASFILLLLLFSNTVNAQTNKVMGRVISAGNKEPIAGATVKVKNGKEVTTTDASGNFSLVAPANASLEITAIGFTTQTIKADFTQVMGISMAISNAELGEVVVVGYGTKKKATLTGSVSTVDSKMFQ